MEILNCVNCEHAGNVEVSSLILCGGVSHGMASFCLCEWHMMNKNLDSDNENVTL